MPVRFSAGTGIASIRWRIQECPSMERVSNSLRMAVLGATATAAAALSAPAAADPLHGYCSGVGQCIDNGTNSPTSNNPPTNFGFTTSPGPASGSLTIDVLVPNN